VPAYPDVMSPEFTVPMPSRMAYVRGDWHLWIYCCAWSIDREGLHLAHSESSEQQIDRAMVLVNGQAITRIEVNPLNARTRFTFDLGATLTTWPDDAMHEPRDLSLYGQTDVNELPSDDLYDQWMLYEPSGSVLTVREDGYFQYEPGNEPTDETQWLPLSSHVFSQN